jgi:hypothetical protein
MRIKSGKRTERAVPTKVCEAENIKHLKGFLNPVMIAHIVVTVILAGTTILMALGS